MQENIFSLSLNALEATLENAGFQKFRAKQIYHWLYVRHIDDFDKMDNLPKNLKAYLKENFTTQQVSICKKEQSIDGSVKYLFATFSLISLIFSTSIPTGNV